MRWIVPIAVIVLLATGVGLRFVWFSRRLRRQLRDPASVPIIGMSTTEPLVRFLRERIAALRRKVGSRSGDIP